MKKTLAILLSLVFFCLCGCKSEEKQKEDVKTALMNVLKGEAEFEVYNEYTKKTTKETLAEGFEWDDERSGRERFWAFAYTFIDLDGDEIEELIVANTRLMRYLFLRYEDGKVLGYVHSGHLYDFKTDGTFATWYYKDFDENWEGKKIDTICSARFEGNKMKIVQNALKCEEKDEYFIDDKAVTKEECDKYFEAFKNKKNTKSKNIDYDENNKMIFN